MSKNLMRIMHLDLDIGCLGPLVRKLSQSIAANTAASIATGTGAAGAATPRLLLPGRVLEDTPQTRTLHLQYPHDKRRQAGQQGSRGQGTCMRVYAITAALVGAPLEHGVYH